MNPKECYFVSEEKRKKYLVQPDNIPSYDRYVAQDQETTSYVKGAPFRFWYNNINAGFSNHWQTSLEIIFVLDDTLTVHINEADYVLQEGDIFLIPPGALHQIDAPESGARFIFITELDLFHQLPSFNYIISLLSQPQHITHEKNPKLYEESARGLLELADCYWGDANTKMLSTCSLLLSWFARIGEEALKETPLHVASVKSGDLVNRLSKVLDYIDTHYTENITLENAAAIACFSKFYFTRLFKQYTNQTFYDYLSSKRIRVAEQMLIVPNLPITDISAKSGFSSLSSFNRTFKRLKGCSPSEYRNLFTIGNQGDNSSETVTDE